MLIQSRYVCDLVARKARIYTLIRIANDTIRD